MTNQVVVDARHDNDPYKMVLKFRLELTPDPMTLMLPRGWTFLKAIFNPDNHPFEGHWLLWLEVENREQANPLAYVFQSMATGVSLPKMVKYLATGFRFGRDQEQPEEVWHLYQYPHGARVVDV